MGIHYVERGWKGNFTGGVAGGEHELSLDALESVGVPDRFVEQGWQLHRMAGGACPAEDVSGVCHVGLVVFGVQVLAIPT